jgi:hypothetical protein
MIVPGQPDTRQAKTETAVQQKLAQVQPGQPTNTPVELVLPRRPRPAPPPKAKGDGLNIEDTPAPKAANPQTRSPEGNPPTEIATDIGPLPADLWTLVGKEPPPETAVSPASKPSPQEAPTPAAAPPTVQRAVTIEETAVETETETPSPEPAGDDINVDELAQRVFQELRHRLATEWERARGRFG